MSNPISIFWEPIIRPWLDIYIIEKNEVLYAVLYIFFNSKLSFQNVYNFKKFQQFLKKGPIFFKIRYFSKKGTQSYKNPLSK